MVSVKPKTGSRPPLDLTPEKSPGYLVTALYRLFYRHMVSRLNRANIPGGGWVYLRELWMEDGLTQRELSRRVGNNDATTRVAIDELEKRKLVRRQRNPTDRRKINVFLTDKGHRSKLAVAPSVYELNGVFFKGFTAEERASFMHLTAKGTHNLGELPPVDGVDSSETLQRTKRILERT